MADDGIRSDREQPLPLMTRIGLALVLVAVLLGSVYGLLHMSVRPINPAQEAPSGHFTWHCSLCHQVTASAPVLKK